MLSELLAYQATERRDFGYLKNLAVVIVMVLTNI